MRRIFIILLISITLAVSADIIETNNAHNGNATYSTSSSIELARTRAFILNEGLYEKYNAGITYFDWMTDNVYNSDLYMAQNKRQLGDTGQDIIEANDCIYVLVSGGKQLLKLNSLGVEVGRTTLSSDFGDPRFIVEDDGYLYVTCYGGYIVKYKASNLSFVSSVKVGSNPEHIIIYDGKLYCTNSGWGKDNRVAVVDIKTFNTAYFQEVMTNPNLIIEVDDHIFVQGYGAAYDYPWGELKNGKYTQLGNASNWCKHGDMLYLVNSVTDWNTHITNNTFYSYNAKTSTLNNSSFLKNAPAELDSASIFAMSANPKNGDIYIMTSDYSNNGTVYHFKNDGTFVTKFTSTGISPKKIVFLDSFISEYNRLNVPNARASAGKQMTLPVSLKNNDEIAGVQFKLTLPAGVSVALNSKNKLMFSKTERDADHTLSGSKAEDGSYTVLLYSADTEAITGNEGSIIDVTLDIDKEMKDGTYEIKISDIVLSTTKAVKINADDVTAQLEVKSYLLGDPNNDGSIDVVDITMIANHILGNNPENFIFAAADVDADGTVDVNDIISIANIILYGSSSNAKPSMAKASKHLANNVTSNESNGDGFTVKNVSVEKGSTVKVDFELTNAAHDFSGIQMDIDLGEGLSFATKSNGKVNVTKGARLEDEDFTLSVAKQEGNQYRALGYYTDGSVIPEKSGTLFTLTLQADDSLADGKTFNCQLDNITLSTKNNEKIQQETQTFTVTIGDATGISNLLNEDGTPAVMYDLTGKRIETPAKSGQVIIIKKGGKVVKVFKK